jgi:hypothetical protein
VLLPVVALVRRADLAVVIGAALAAKAVGKGTRPIAAALDRPWETVRGWLRRFGARATARGLPVFSHSMARSSSVRASNASAMRFNASCRSAGMDQRQRSNAVRAARNVASTSARPETQTS